VKFVTVACVLKGLVYLAVVIAIMSVATTRFEIVVLAGMVQLYATVLYNFSLIGVATDVNNHAGFVRFRILATAHGVTENENGKFKEQEDTLAEHLKVQQTAINIRQWSHSVVSIYALFKIVQAIFFS
jgi:hypothetical protein